MKARSVVATLLGPLGRIFLLSALLTLHQIGFNAGVLSDALSAMLAGWALPLFVVSWAYTDAIDTRYWPAFHYGLWFFVAWPLVLPLYVFRTRGRRGWPLLAVLYFALLAPVGGAYIGYALRSYVPGEFLLQ